MWNKTSLCFSKPCYLDHKREKVHLFSEYTGCLVMQTYYTSFCCGFQRPWSNPLIFVNHANIFIHFRKTTLKTDRLVFWCTSIYLSDSLGCSVVRRAENSLSRIQRRTFATFSVCMQSESILSEEERRTTFRRLMLKVKRKLDSQKCQAKTFTMGKLRVN